MKKIIVWLVISSKDPNKVSLFVKGAIASIATYVLFFAGIFHLGIGQADVSQLGDILSKIVEAGLQIVSSVVALIGLVRKVRRTIDGAHAGLNQLE